MAERMTYLLVDGENIDATLGTSILGRRPRPEERPRWDRLLEWAERAFDQDVSGLFFLAATTELPTTFVQALLAIGFKPIPLSGAARSSTSPSSAPPRRSSTARPTWCWSATTATSWTRSRHCATAAARSASSGSPSS